MLEYIWTFQKFNPRKKLSYKLLERNDEETPKLFPGNHALALAYHGSLLSIPVTVCMPVNAPITKVKFFFS